MGLQAYKDGGVTESVTGYLSILGIKNSHF